MSPSVSPEAINVVNGASVYYDEHNWPYVINADGYRVFVGTRWREHTRYYQRLRLRNLRAQRCA